MEYYLIILLCGGAELSNRINTRNLFKKAGLLLIIVGAFIHLAHRENNLIEYGLILYIAIDYVNAYFRKYRRKSDLAHG